MTQNQNKSELYAANHYIVQEMAQTTRTEPRTITEALLDAWDEFNQEITDRPAQNLYLYNDYARVELFKMMVDLETDKARTSI